MQAVGMGQPADLEEQPLWEFHFGEDGVDEMTVKATARQGRANLVTFWFRSI